MAEPLTINVQQAAKAAPAVYTVSGAVEVEPLAAFATFDGTAAAAAFLPSLGFYSASGLLITRAFPTASVSAGGTADVSYFPGISGSAASSGGAGTRTVPLNLDTPDGVGNAYSQLNGNLGFTVANAGRHTYPTFVTGANGTWETVMRIPSDYSTAGTVTLSWAVNTNVGNMRHLVSSFVVANGATYNGTYTDETTVSTTVPATALFRFDTTWLLSTALVAGSDLFLKVTRNGVNVLDTCTQDAMLVRAVFSYTST